ncbi:sll1873 [Synechocystis sp. PCC 6803]|uniref:Sll1873 protein n=1 Tax=Synechocystis sp. (strain ATCC 27184 / PCC 6803 / Kazusa) TaxID=1111708 RepID=P74135_SYNY3|nr:MULTISPECIES: hypothetical protein [unclassified Synechocystis]7SC7_BG Chain BG, Sll1873 protein [Synechocystis sp. PCC 6803 substr. Kazusa]7SC7_CO Chain CO, Sll1873 protein [Synechocystis sp. PCC 6803 substr. Kazusa]7SC9_BF Chain BF, Sll1873 protein [Synechocystis sp. PCC 6803 substr. Kazusa]7SC9_CO Chain CO, Sll1873 protein [Synechocystis sp. PCC 6803 substr. Kazusa]7SCB_BI Chain BI, Sll1873 protein [Synechocystis sp. PCC 6803 substr. Kazusa]BAM55069.1 hypothetical protein BEST7613_6138 
MLKKLFGAKKEFYVQLDESQAPAQVEEADVAIVKSEVAPVEKPAPTTSKKTSIKKKSATKAAAPVETPASAPVAPAPKAKVDPSQVAFASGDPIPQNVARRTPGPSLNRFKEMARQVKVKR